MALQKSIIISLTGGDRTTFINSLVYELSQVGFTDMETPISGYTASLSYNNLIISFKPTASTNNGLDVLTSINIGGTAQRVNGSTIAVGGSGCGIFVYVLQSSNMILLNIAPKDGNIGKGNNTIFSEIANDIEICGHAIAGGTSSYYSTNNEVCILKPQRTYPKGENVFFLDNVCPVVTSDNNFVVDLTNLITLGGAEVKHTYTMTNGDNYYCPIGNIGIKIDGDIIG